MNNKISKMEDLVFYAICGSVVATSLVATIVLAILENKKKPKDFKVSIKNVLPNLQEILLRARKYK
jgi:hypothetical protein